MLPNSQPPSPLLPFLSLFISCTAADGDPARNLELYPEDYGAPQPQPGQGQGQGLGARTLNMVRWGGPNGSGSRDRDKDREKGLGLAH